MARVNILTVSVFTFLLSCLRHGSKRWNICYLHVRWTVSFRFFFMYILCIRFVFSGECAYVRERVLIMSIHPLFLSLFRSFHTIFPFADIFVLPVGWNGLLYLARRREKERERKNITEKWGRHLHFVNDHERIIFFPAVSLSVFDSNYITTGWWYTFVFTLVCRYRFNIYFTI